MRMYHTHKHNLFVLLQVTEELPKDGGVPPKHVAVNKRLYLCVSWMCMWWF